MVYIAERRRFPHGIPLIVHRHSARAFAFAVLQNVVEQGSAVFSVKLSIEARQDGIAVPFVPL